MVDSPPIIIVALVATVNGITTASYDILAQPSLGDGPVTVAQVDVPIPDVRAVVHLSVSIVHAIIDTSTILEVGINRTEASGVAVGEIPFDVNGTDASGDRIPLGYAVHDGPGLAGTITYVLVVNSH